MKPRKLVPVSLYGGPVDGTLLTIDSGRLPTLTMLTADGDTVTYTARATQHYSIEDQMTFMKRLTLWFDQR